MNTRCSIIAACNVKGEIEDGKSITANSALASPLLSRFDLILLILDRNRGDSWDSELCDRILRGRSFQTGKEIESIWDFDQLKLYINFIRNNLNPSMTKISELVLSRYYQLQRRSDTLKCARTTVRLLESLVRLAQSHAKLMFHSEVQLEDSMMAVILCESSLSSSQTLETKINLNTIAIEPEWYEKIEREMLYKLEINKNNFIDEEVDILTIEEVENNNNSSNLNTQI